MRCVDEFYLLQLLTEIELAFPLIGQGWTPAQPSPEPSYSRFTTLQYSLLRSHSCSLLGANSDKYPIFSFPDARHNISIIFRPHELFNWLYAIDESEVCIL